jgi:hypothetical protein
MPADATQSDPSRAEIKRSSNGRYRGRPRLITRESLDKRTRAAQQFDAIANAIARDLGGEANLSTVAKHLVEAFAGVAIAVGDLNARLVLGQAIDVTEQAQAISTMVRVASRIGINRVARDVTPTLGDLIREDQERQREAAQREEVS